MGPRRSGLEHLPGGGVPHGRDRAGRRHLRLGADRSRSERGGRVQEARPASRWGRDAVSDTLERGWIAPELAEEFAGLSLSYTVLDRGSGRSPKELRERLRELSNRFAGPQAINLRHQPIPWAYRVFYRHIGLDPDEQRTPVEALALERMRKGGFPSQNLLDDALTIAIAESGVALRAFDADKVSGRPGIR